MYMPSSSSSGSLPPSITRRVDADCPIVVPEVWEHVLDFLNIKELTSIGALSHQMTAFCDVQDVWERCLAHVHRTSEVDKGDLRLYARSLWYDTRKVYTYVEKIRSSIAKEPQIPRLHDPILQARALVEFISNNVVIGRKLLCDFVADGFITGIDAVFAGRHNFEKAHRIHIAELTERRVAMQGALEAARLAQDPEAVHLQEQELEQITACISLAESGFDNEKSHYVQLSLKEALAIAIVRGDFATVKKIWEEIERCGGSVISLHPEGIRSPILEANYLIDAAKSVHPEILAFIITKIGSSHRSLSRAFERACDIGDFRAAWTIRYLDNAHEWHVNVKIKKVLYSERFAPHEQYLLLVDLYRNSDVFEIGHQRGFMRMFTDAMHSPAMANPLIVKFFVQNTLMNQDEIFMYVEMFAAEKGTGKAYSDESLQVFIQNIEPFKGCLQRAQTENPALKERLDELLIPQNWPILKKIAEQNPRLRNPQRLEELLLHELPKTSTSSAAETLEEIEKGFLEAVKNGKKARFAHYFQYVEAMSPEVRCKAYIASLKWMDNAMEVQLRKYVPGWRKLFLEHRRMH